MMQERKHDASEQETASAWLAESSTSYCLFENSKNDFLADSGRLAALVVKQTNWLLSDVSLSVELCRA
jgi:hypothetical protein